MSWNPNSNKHKAMHGGYKGKPTKSQVKAALNFFDTSDIDFSNMTTIVATSGENKPGTQLKMDL